MRAWREVRNFASQKFRLTWGPTQNLKKCVISRIQSNPMLIADQEWTLPEKLHCPLVCVMHIVLDGCFRFCLLYLHLVTNNGSRTADVCKVLPSLHSLSLWQCSRTFRDFVSRLEFLTVFRDFLGILEKFLNV